MYDICVKMNHCCPCSLFLHVSHFIQESAGEELHSATICNKYRNSKKSLLENIKTQLKDFEKKEKKLDLSLLKSMN